jgi:hypothetical protein
MGEPQQAVGRLGVPMSQQELSAITRRIDKNGDGTLDYYEFSKLIDLDPAELCAFVVLVCLVFDFSERFFCVQSHDRQSFDSVLSAHCTRKSGGCLGSLPEHW